ncbi:hypothetical protein CI1B_27350 [Bradyrhizobium ivorense]|uniref:Uncharacterized protein n=1 Tax=Bradyrhizobium ivorense TaxID=2511166 RepID=A0A508T3K9_9BRAD|nr:hypothetical protein CI1B_27350 [Bradyrhizobium ivorense]VIO71275.1 hypothetical protein CI41S_29460 [Bradyrhizobium ivorense]
MASCYLCGTGLAKGQGARRNVRTGTSVAGLFSIPPSAFLVALAALVGVKVPSIRSYFGLRTLCPSCTQRLDAQRSLRRKIVLLIVGSIFFITIAAMLSGQR